MKIFIGPPNNYCDFFTWKVLRRAERNKNQSKFWKWVDKTEWVYDLCKSLDRTVDAIWFNRWWYNIPRRTNTNKIKLHNYDTWSFDMTMAPIILQGLKNIRDAKQGAPYVADEDVPDELKSSAAPPKENEWDLDDNFFKRWDWVINEMIWAFEHINDDSWEDALYSGGWDIVSDEITTEDGKMFETKFGENSTIKYDKKTADEMYARINRGTILFGKYYRNLWT